MRKKIEDIIITGSILGCVGATVGALAGWGLSFITLPALVRGGIIGSAFPVLFVAWYIGKLLYNLYNGKGIEEKDKNKLIHSSKVALAFAAIGVGLAAVGCTSGADIGAITICTYFAIEGAVKEIKRCSSNKKIKKIIIIGFLSCVSATLGALAGWGLSFTTLPTLVRGGIIGSTFPVLFVVWYIGKLLYNLYNGKGIEEKDKNRLIDFSIQVLPYAAIGVGLASVGFTSGAAIGAITIYTNYAIVTSLKTMIELCLSEEQGGNDLSKNSPKTSNEENNTLSSQLLKDANPQKIDFTQLTNT